MLPYGNLYCNFSVKYSSITSNIIKNNNTHKFNLTQSKYCLFYISFTLNYFNLVCMEKRNNKREKRIVPPTRILYRDFPHL